MRLLAGLSRAALAGAYLLLGCGVAGAAPAVTLSPGAGPPTTTIRVSGSGFGATQLIDIYFDTADLCLAASDASGAFICSIDAPSSAQPQNHWITAAQRSNGLAAQKPLPSAHRLAQFHGMNAKHTGFNQYENTIT